MLPPPVIDWSSTLSPEEQLVQHLLTLEETGLLSHPQQLPTVRAWSVLLNLPPPMIQRAYTIWQASSLTWLLSPMIRQAQELGLSKAQVVQALELLW